jgi:DnaJ domain
MTLDPMQAYHVLRLNPGATLDELKVAYRDLAQVWHPDRFPDNPRLREKAAATLQQINEAYAVLRDYRPPPPSPIPPPHAPPPVPFVAPRMAHRRPAAAAYGDVRGGLFTGSMRAMRRSLDVLWPSATYARRPTRRFWPRAWAVVGLLILAAAAAILWLEWYFVQ